MADKYTPLNTGTAVPTMETGWSATKFNGWGTTQESKYNVSNMTYPMDLQSEIYGGNMVVFYINIADASKFQTSSGNNIGSYSMKNLDVPRVRAGFDGSTPIENLGGASVGANVVKDVAMGGGAGALFGAKNGITSYGEKGLLGLVTSTLKGMGAGIFGGAGAAIAANGKDYVTLNAAQSIAGTTTREQKRLRSAIALHIPNSLNVRYTTDWSSTDTSELFMASATGNEAIKALSGDDNRNLTGTIGAIAANVGLSGNKGGAASALTGLAANPRKELVFKGVDFRTFQFDYSFFPRDETEAKLVENIINAFKFHMQPEFKDTNSFLYLYPSEFDITYYNNGVENLHLHRHTSCVLTDMSINYAPNGNFNTFANGMPTQINVTLTFKELATMSKELVNRGL